MKGSNPEAAKAGLALLKSLAADTHELRLPPEQGTASTTQRVLPFSVMRGTRSYLETLTHQINGSYEHGWYDGCAVMMRRLLESLIIEVFEERRMADKIQDTSGNFLPLERLVGKMTGEPAWNLSRVTRRALSDVKSLGDNSAHVRRFIAHRHDIDNVKAGFRTAVQELLDVGGLA